MSSVSRQCRLFSIGAYQGGESVHLHTKSSLSRLLLKREKPSSYSLMALEGGKSSSEKKGKDTFPELTDEERRRACKQACFAFSLLQSKLMECLRKGQNEW